MITVLLTGTLFVVATVIFHIAGLTVLSAALTALAPRRIGRSRHVLVWFLGFAVLVILAIHTVEAWCWAAVYYLLGEFADFEDALYFSAVTATTLGYGDVVLGERWRLLATFEAMAGLILFAVSTAYLLALLRRFLDPDSERRRR